MIFTLDLQIEKSPLTALAAMDGPHSVKEARQDATAAPDGVAVPAEAGSRPWLNMGILCFVKITAGP